MAEKTYTLTLRLPDGSRKYFRGKTKKEAEQKRDAVKFQLGMGVDISCSTTVGELAETWYKIYKEDNADLHVRTKENIRGTMDRYVIPKLGRMKVIDVKPIHIQSMMASVSKYSKSTQKKVLQITKAIFTTAVENGMIPRSPVPSSIKAGGAAPAEKRPLTESQCAALLEAVRGTRTYLFVLILLHSGLRAGEALGLMWKDIDFDAGTITVNRSIVYPESNRRGEVNPDMKTKASHRTIPLPWPVVAELQAERRKSNSIWVFSMQDGSFLSKDSYDGMLELIRCRTIGAVPTQRELVKRTLDFHVHPHLLRHTCITRWFEKGLDVKEVQYLAGHARVDITLGIYTHYCADRRGAETAEKIRSMVV